MRYSATLLVAIIGFTLAACGGRVASGTYELDRVAVETDTIEMVRKQAGGTLPPGAAARIREKLRSFSMTLVLSKDGSFAVSGQMGPEKIDASGTWKIKGKELITTTTHDGGRKMESPEIKSAAYEEGKVTLTGSLPVPIILIRRAD